MAAADETWRADGDKLWFEGWHIARFSPCGAGGEQEAADRARLAAAAPMLLRALEELEALERSERVPTTASEIIEAALSKIRAPQ